MQKLDFAAALDLVVANDPRYSREGYYFLRDALDFTIKLRKKKSEAAGHVTGPQLLEGIRQFALKQFGPMVPTVFAYWGVTRGDDFGEMVFNLIRVGIFGKTERDRSRTFAAATRFTTLSSCHSCPQPAGGPSPHAVRSACRQTELNQRRVSSLPYARLHLSIPALRRPLATCSFPRPPRAPGRCRTVSASSCRKITARRWPACRCGWKRAASTKTGSSAPGSRTFSSTCSSRAPRRAAPASLRSGSRTPGGYINAYTSFDRTVYWIDIPAKGVPHRARACSPMR